ncbi:MAG: helix-turn-helix transcriptional regulator [Longimicrobiales bacterium]
MSRNPRTSRHCPDWVRALAVERVRELKRAGWSNREIARAHGWNGSRVRTQPRPTLDKAFTNALDTVAQGMAFYDMCGNLVYRNRWLHQALQMPNGETLGRALADFVCELRQLARRREIVREPQVERLHTKELPVMLRPVRRFSGSLVAYDLFGVGPTLMVAVDTAPVMLPAPEDARKRFGLTRAETRIAYYLAEGLRTDEIAHVLCLSPHTVRRHTERVLGKLGAPTRGDVANVMAHTGPQAWLGSMEHHAALRVSADMN